MSEYNILTIKSLFVFAVFAVVFAVVAAVVAVGAAVVVVAIVVAVVAAGNFCCYPQSLTAIDQLSLQQILN